MTYNVFGGTLSLTQSIKQKTVSCPATDPDSAFVNRSHDTDDDYFGFTQ